MACQIIKALNILDAAERSGNLRTALGAIREARGELQVQQKQEVIITVRYRDRRKNEERGVERLSGGRK